MEKERLSGMLSAQVHCADNCIQRECNRKFGEIGLTNQQAMVIAYLVIADRQKEKVNQRRIQEFLQISNPSVVSLVKSLEKKEFLMRDNDPEDGRNTLLVLTDKGFDTAVKIMPMLDELDTEISKALTMREVATLQKAMTKIIKAFNK